MKFDLLTIDDLGKLERGRSRYRPRDDQSLYGGAYPFVQTGDIKRAPFYITSYSQTYNEKGLAQSRLWDPGTLCITIAANIADTAFLSFRACFPDSILGFIPYKNKSNVRYVKYCFDVYKTTLEAISKGTTQDNLSLDKLTKVKFRIPPLPVQQKIAAVLSAYDDLIENNNRRIAILEKMAEELYRDWFVRLVFPGHEKTKIVKGVPEGWEIKKIGEVCSKVTDGAHASPRFVDDGKFMASVKDMTDFGFDIESMKTIGEPDFIKLVQSDCKPLKDDILIAKDGSYLKHVFVWDQALDLVILSSIAILRPNKAIIQPYFFSLTLKQESVKSMMSAYVSGSALPRIILNDFKKMQLLVPKMTLILHFESTVRPMYQQIRNALDSISILKSTRNRLLSRLMSGKIDVEDLDIQFPPSMDEPDKEEKEASN